MLVNPAPPPLDVEPEPLEPGTFVFVGRLTSQKGLPVALEALARGRRGALVLVGDGPERARSRRSSAARGSADRVRFAGALPRDDVLGHLAGARAAVLSSVWENLPHAAVEALAVGTPVVATAVGGVPEVVHDDENGLLVPAGRSCGAWQARFARMLDDDELRDRLAAGGEAVGRGDRPRRDLHAARADPRGGGSVTPRVLFVGRGRITLPLAPWLRASGTRSPRCSTCACSTPGPGAGDPRFRLLPDAPRPSIPGCRSRSHASSARSARRDRRRRSVRRRRGALGP